MYRFIVFIFVLAITFLNINSQVLRQWSANYSSAGTDEDYGIKIDASGNIYQVGELNANSSSADLILVKYNQSGAVLWSKTFNGTGNAQEDYPNLLIDQNGNPIIVCNSKNPGNIYSICAIKFNPVSGDTTWVRRWNGPGGAWAEYRRSVVDQSGNIYAGGLTAPTSGIDADGILVKWDNNGNLQWAHRHGPGNVTDWVDEFIVDASGNVIMCGNEGVNYQHGFFVKKVNSGGTAQWSLRWDPTGIFDMAALLRMDQNGNYYSFGNVGNTGSGTSGYGFLKCNTNGSLLWSVQIPPSAEPSRNWFNPYFDNAGNIILIGADSAAATGFDYNIRKYSPSGSLMWNIRYNGPANGKDEAYQCVIDAADNIYVLGNSVGSGSGSDITIIKYNSSGAQQWIQRYNGTANGNDSYGTISMDIYNNLIVTGRANNNGTGDDVVVLKYDLSGNLLWSQTYNGLANGYDAAWYQAMDNGYNLFVSGYLTNPGTGQDIGLLKYIQAPPVAPVLSASAISQSKINLSWTDSNPNENGFRVERSTNGGVNWVFRDSVTNLSYTDSLLTTNTTYHYRIYAKNLAGLSPVSNTVNATTFPNPPVAVPILVSPPNNSNGQSTTPLLDWDTVSAATNYKIQVSVDSLFTSPAFDTSGVVLSQVIVPAGRLNNNTTYFWRVRGRNNGGEGPWSLIWRFTTSLTSITQTSTEIPDVFKLYNNYPNPFNPVTKIKFDIPAVSGNSVPVKIAVYNLLGEEVTVLTDKQIQPGSYEVNFDASMHSTGVYFYRIQAGEFTDVKKMILIK